MNDKQRFYVGNDPVSAMLINDNVIYEPQYDNESLTMKYKLVKTFKNFTNGVDRLVNDKSMVLRDDGAFLLLTPTEVLAFDLEKGKFIGRLKGSFNSISTNTSGYTLLASNGSSNKGVYQITKHLTLKRLSSLPSVFVDKIINGAMNENSYVSVSEDMKDKKYKIMNFNTVENTPVYSSEPLGAADIQEGYFRFNASNNKFYFLARYYLHIYNLAMTHIARQLVSSGIYTINFDSYNNLLMNSKNEGLIYREMADTIKRKIMLPNNADWRACCFFRTETGMHHIIQNGVGHYFHTHTYSESKVDNNLTIPTINNWLILPNNKFMVFDQTGEDSIKIYQIIEERAGTGWPKN